jgi:AcrR family transcriptional regulator
LPAQARRAHLLAAAARLVRAGGWTALSMQGVAIAAGVSRQLVYEHFASADELFLATLTHLFERTYAGAEAIARAGRRLDETVRAAFVQVLELPPEERHALRSLAAERGEARPGLARARTRLRVRIASIWVPFIRARTGADDAEAAALAWMLITASWALSDVIADGTLERARGIETFVRLVETTLAAWGDPSHRGSASHRRPRTRRVDT